MLQFWLKPRQISRWCPDKMAGTIMAADIIAADLIAWDKKAARTK